MNRPSRHESTTDRRRCPPPAAAFCAAPPSPRARQRGGLPLLLVLSLILAATVAGGVAIRAAVTDLRSSGAQRSSKAGFYCAEGGLQAARPYFAAHVGQWSAMFDVSQPPPAGYPVRGDLDGDGVPDYEVTLRDNIDEFPPLADDPLHDNDLSAVMIARCIDPALGPHQLEEIVVFNGRGTDYRYQAGHGSGHTGNEN